MANKPFEKFINKEPKGAKKKEAIRQEKRKTKAEARALCEEMRRLKWEKQRGIVSDKEKGPGTDSPYAGFKGQTARPQDSRARKQDPRFPKPAIRPRTPGRELVNRDNLKPLSPDITPPVNTGNKDQNPETATKMPLNKFVAHAGVCGRREAAELIKQGLVTVNGDKIFEPGYKVIGNEDVKVKGKKIFSQHNLVYILLNKPKDYITTAKDPEGRKTVLDLIKGATKERVYSVGRLDRNTTGVLILTNDGELAQKLTHPSYQIKKVYEVKLDKPVAKKDFEAILTGLTLEDGFVKADSLAYADDKDKSIVGIEIHSGRNRIVRRMFDHLVYDVKGLDRVMFANLTKKNVERGTWRMLMEKEVRLLKFMNQSFLKKNKD